MGFGEGSSDVALALLKGLLTLILIVGGLLQVVDVGKKKREKAMKAIPPSDPAPPTQPQPFSTVESTGRFLEAHTAVVLRGEWALSELRVELRDCRAEKDQIAQDAQRTAATLVRTERELRSAIAKLATLQEAEAHWRGEATRLESERDQLKARQRVERVNLDQIATPLRPPALPKGTP